MKKLLLVCAVVLGVSAASHAQGRMQMAPADRAAQLKTQLALTDDQTAKVTAIYTAQAKSMDSLRNAGGDMSAMRPMMTATNAKVKAVLTADQAKKFDEMQAARMNRGGGGMGGGGGTPPPPRK
jgi:Spy/CpxP family protein refolding chaperone